MSTPPEPALHRLRVLIVDDTAADRKLLRLKLHETDFEVVEAGDGIEALELLRLEAVDAVISDILMPRLDGYRLCAQIRRDPQLAALRFVLHTSSYTSPADEKLAYRFGADAFLRKPAAVEEIAAAIREPSRRPAAKSEGPPDTAELEVLHHYSDALVRKLEQKNTELEETTRRLHAANQKLMERSRQLEQAKAELQRLNDNLEKRVRERTAQLETANRELEQFGDAVAHDLRGPIRTIQGYGAILASECAETLTDECKDYLRRIPICDEALLRVALENVIGNAWKFSAHTDQPRIEVGRIRPDEPVFFVRDNGAGFDMTLRSAAFHRVRPPPYPK